MVHGVWCQKGGRPRRALALTGFPLLLLTVVCGSVLLQGAVADRGRLLDATDTALTESLVDTKRNVEKAKEQHKR